MLANAALWLTLLIVVHVIVVALLGWQVYRRNRGWTRYLGWGLLFPWLIGVIAITVSGLTADMTAVLSPLGLIMTVTVVSGLGLLAVWRPLGRVIAALPLTWLMGIQVYRVLGIVFLFGWLAGDLPTALGPVTAFNDVLVGVSAGIVALLYARRHSIRLAQFWNVFGLLDFAYAVTVGVLAAPHALRLLETTPDTAALGLPPLAFITLWAVPLSTFLHVTCLARLRAARQASTLSPLTPSAARSAPSR